MRLDLNTLTRSYRTDLISQRLRELNCRFYTDTLFSKDKFLFVNTCAHIFENEEFVQIISVGSKSEIDATLDRIKD